MARQMGLPGSWVRDPFDTETTLKSFEEPVLIFHGQRDEIVPHAHSAVLHETAQNSRLVTLECGHNDCPPDQNKYWREIKSFLDKHRLLPTNKDVTER